MAREMSERAASGVVSPLRGAVGGNPAMSRLLDELERYAQIKGEHVLRGAGEKAVGMLGNVGSEGGAAGAVGQAVGQAVGGGGGGGGGGLGKAVMGAVGGLARSRSKGAGGRKSTLIIHDIDIGRPIQTVYNQWTQYDSFSEFMRTIEGVEKQDEVRSNWRLKIGPSRRTWQGRVTEQIPDRRIAWTSEGAKGTTKGVVTFHPLCDDLTRVGVVMEYFPAGPVEKVANMFRFASRRTRLDLRNFRRFISDRDEATGAWRGEIHDGEITKEHEEEEEPETEAAGAEAQGQEEEQPEEERPEQEAREPEEAEPEGREGDEGDEQPEDVEEPEPEEEEEEQRERSRPRARGARAR